MKFSYKLIVYKSVNGVDMWNDNIDVEVRFPEGGRYAATFFTLKNIEYLFEKNVLTGECGKGLYFWASDMILVKKITESVIRKTIEDLLRVKEFERAFLKIS